GMQPPAGQTSFPADWNAVSPDYFKTLNMRLVSGRDFTAQDAAGAPGAIIINEAMARSVWHTTDVLGRQFESDAIGNSPTTLTVVGIAPDAQVDTLGAAVRPFVYVPLAQPPALSLIPQRVAGAVAASLGGVVLVLAAIGIYGVTSYSVDRRTREIGIRIALGANRGSVLRLVIRQGAVLTAIGVGLGL